MSLRRSLTVRARWTLMCAAMAVGCSAIVLAVTLVFTARFLHDRAPQAFGGPDRIGAPAQVPAGGPGQIQPGQIQPGQIQPGQIQPGQIQLAAGHAVTTSVLADVRRIGLMTMVAVTGLSVGLGWIVAGRMIRPVHRITDAARSVSGARLGDRIALTGPDDELKRLADTFDAMLDRLDAAFAAQRTFVADASHELRTPLAVMRAEVEVALDDPDAPPAELRNALTATLTTLESTTELVERLLNLSRADALVRVDDTDLAESARLALGDRSMSLRGIDGTDLQTHVALAAAPVRGDRVLLDRMVANLVDNAVRYNRLAGSIWVTTSLAGSTTSDAPMVVIVVENDGPLVRPDEVDRLFDRFHRRGDSVERVGGMGLGLAIVAAVARTHGGSVSAIARTEGGLRVEVRLPTAG